MEIQKWQVDKGDGFGAWGSACKLQRVTFWFGFLCILAWRLEFVPLFCFYLLYLGPHLWWVSCHWFVPWSPFIWQPLPPFCVGWGQEKTQDLMNNFHGNNFFPGEGCDEDWPDVLDILWQRTSGLGSLETFLGQIFFEELWQSRDWLIEKSDKFLGTCLKWEWKWQRFDIFSLACACQAQLTSFHKLLWLFVYMHWYFDSWEA